MDIDENLYLKLANLLYNHEAPKRKALSSRYPFFKKPILYLKHNSRTISNLLDLQLRCYQSSDKLPMIVARHQSVLRRRLGDSDLELQEQKITNLKQAIKHLDGLVIEPNHIFSLWHSIGKPTYDKGYVDGMLLANGAVVPGLGGGLCQLSNFLYWIFLHTSMQTIERYHHSMDVFPDSGRTLPFGGGATILYNFIDLKLKNTSNQPLQLKIWLTDTHLKGQVLTTERIPEKYHIVEQNHCFVKRGEIYFRYNEILKECRVNGVLQSTEHITTNFAPVLYKVTPDYISNNKFILVDFTDKDLNKL
jgi:vancomycin resistance protein VanW